MNQSVTGGNHSYKIIEVVGQRGDIDGDKVAHFQVSLKLGFRIES